VASPHRRTALIDRRIQHRDARLFVLATEGTETEPQYFLGLQERGLCDRSRVHIEVIPTPPNPFVGEHGAMPADLTLLDGKHGDEEGQEGERRLASPHQWAAVSAFSS